MLERLNVYLRGCDGKGAQDGDCIETLNYYFYYWLCSECSIFVIALVTLFSCKR